MQTRIHKLMDDKIVRLDDEDDLKGVYYLMFFVR